MQGHVGPERALSQQLFAAPQEMVSLWVWMQAETQVPMQAFNTVPHCAAGN